MRLRDAERRDVADLLRLIRALAEYEKRAGECRIAAADLEGALFDERPRCHAAVAEVDHRVVGFALWFFNYSTFTGKPGLYLEDIFVEPESRGRGIGRAFFGYLARHAVAAGCARMDWAVLDWNAPAVAFYRVLGARALDEWTTQRLDGQALAALAG